MPIDLDDIERRHAADDAAGRGHQALHGDYIHADRGALLAEVKRLREALDSAEDLIGDYHAGRR